MKLNELLRARFGLPDKKAESIETNQTMANILSHRSHRRFSSKPVPQALLDALLAAAFSAPSKSDLQQASVIEIRDRAKQRRIANASPKTGWLAEAPIFLVWCGDSRRIRRLAEWRGHAFANDHLDAFMNAAVDAGICMQTFIIAAESHGLGCCPVSEIRDHIQLLSDELQLPQHVFPVAGLCVGWPRRPGALSLRLPLSVTVKRDRYEDENLLEQVSAYDQRREILDNTPPDAQRFVEDFGVSSNYGWSENRTRQYSRPAREDFGRYIRKQGFNLA